MVYIRNPIMVKSMLKRTANTTQYHPDIMTDAATDIIHHIMNQIRCFKCISFFSISMLPPSEALRVSSMNSVEQLIWVLQ